MPDIVSQLRTASVEPSTRAREVALAWSLEGSAVALALLASDLVEDLVTRRELERRARHDVFESDLMGVRDGVVRLAATRLSWRGRAADAVQEGRLALLSCLRSYNWRIARLDVFAAPVVARAVLRAGHRDPRDALAHTIDLPDEVELSDGTSAEDVALDVVGEKVQARGIARLALLLPDGEVEILRLWSLGVVTDSEIAAHLGAGVSDVAMRSRRLAALLRHPGMAGCPGLSIPGDR